MRDAAVRVRQALCAHLKACRNVPHDVALALARDCESVALPMLEFSEVLSDEDLIEIVHSQNAAKQKAIAGRRRVSAPLSEALAETENVEVVATLFGNAGAEIGEPTMQKVVDDFADNERVQNLLAKRDALPVTVAERLVGLVSYRARHLYSNGHLTPSLLLRALSMGEIAFFEMGLAVMAQVPLDTARTHIYDEGAVGFTEIYQQAALPPSLLPAYLAGIEVVRQAEGMHQVPPARFRQHMLWAIRTHYPDIRAANFEELLDKLIQPSG